MRFALHLLGVEVFAFSIERDRPDPRGITGGSSHNFERSMEIEEVEPEDFGFTNRR